MPPDLLPWLATAFSGGQLAVIVFIFTEIRNLRRDYGTLRADHVALRLQNDQQDRHINGINQKLANLMGRLSIPYKEDLE